MDYEQQLKGILKEESWLINLLETVRELQLPDWYLAAGVVRNTVWDVLHGYEHRTKLFDVDVIYFDPADLSLEAEKKIEKKLREVKPGVNWEVVNQARSHQLNPGSSQPKSSTQSVAYWSETPTCVGVRLEENDSLTICAPHGLEDLMNLVVQPIPEPYTNLALYASRIAEKRWHETWPKLNIH